MSERLPMPDEPGVLVFIARAAPEADALEADTLRACRVTLGADEIERVRRALAANHHWPVLCDVDRRAISRP